MALVVRTKESLRRGTSRFLRTTKLARRGTRLALWTAKLLPQRTRLVPRTTKLAARGTRLAVWTARFVARPTALAGRAAKRARRIPSPVPWNTVLTPRRTKLAARITKCATAQPFGSGPCRRVQRTRPWLTPENLGSTIALEGGEDAIRAEANVERTRSTQTSRAPRRRGSKRALRRRLCAPRGHLEDGTTVSAHELRTRPRGRPDRPTREAGRRTSPPSGSRRRER